MTEPLPTQTPKAAPDRGLTDQAPGEPTPNTLTLDTPTLDTPTLDTPALDARALRRQAMQTLGRVSGLGAQLVGVVGISVWLGAQADARWRLTPWLTLLGLGVGLTAAALVIRRLAWALRRASRS